VTLNQFKQITKQVLKSVSRDLLEDAEKKYKSGGIDTAKFANDALLPKIVLKAALAGYDINLPEEYETLSKNLRNF
jgi:hypothetical protein